MLGIFQKFPSALPLRPSIKKTSDKTLLGALANGFNQADILECSFAQARNELNGILHAHMEKSDFIFSLLSTGSHCMST